MGLIDALVSKAGEVVSKVFGRGLPVTPTTAERLLREDEERLAREVFADSLPYGAIYLSNGLGLERRQYTVPHPLRKGAYLVHVGPAIYEDATDSSVVDNGQAGDALFIHELTHVWQSVHGRTHLSYVFDSIHAQITKGSRAYELDPSKVGKERWGSFGAEQQAMIVQRWYAGGMSTAAPEFAYIRDNIRPGRA